MIILALEFSSARRSVALARDETILGEAVEAGGGRETHAFGLIEKILRAAKIEREEIEAIVVGLGPGSYTGIRAAIAIAQGWQLTRDVKLAGISSVEAMAARAQVEKIFGRVNVAVDAQRNEFYLATFDISENGWKEIAPLKILPAAEIQTRAATGEILAGPEAEKLFPNCQTIFPDAATLAKLAARKNHPTGEILEPIYLREVNFVKAPPPKLIPS